MKISKKIQSTETRGSYRSKFLIDVDFKRIPYDRLEIGDSVKLSNKYNYMVAGMLRCGCRNHWIKLCGKKFSVGKYKNTIRLWRTV